MLFEMNSVHIISTSKDKKTPTRKCVKSMTIISASTGSYILRKPVLIELDSVTSLMCTSKHFTHHPKFKDDTSLCLLKCASLHVAYQNLQGRGMTFGLIKMGWSQLYVCCCTAFVHITDGKGMCTTHLLNWKCLVHFGQNNTNNSELNGWLNFAFSLIVTDTASHFANLHRCSKHLGKYLLPLRSYCIFSMLQFVQWSINLT